MTRLEVASFARQHWVQLGIIALAIIGWVVRVEAAVGQMDRLTDAHGITESLGRLECLRDRQRATLAGVPCGELLREWGIR
jgi:hypothetical protein